MIYELKNINDKELNELAEIWLESNIETHSYINQNYWKDNLPFVKEAFKNARLFVVDNNNEILGFCGMIDSYIAGIFIKENYRGEGYGTQLLDILKEKYDILTLKVYDKNKKAINFYHKNNFIKIDNSFDENNELEISMKWEN